MKKTYWIEPTKVIEKPEDRFKVKIKYSFEEEYYLDDEQYALLLDGHDIRIKEDIFAAIEIDSKLAGSVNQYLYDNDWLVTDIDPEQIKVEIEVE